MTTVITEDPEEAAAFIREGQIAAFPTETVYGLGGTVFNPEAVQAIFKAKERPSDNPLIAHISGLDQINLLATTISESAQTLIDAFFPGPLTIIFQAEVRGAGYCECRIRYNCRPDAVTPRCASFHRSL